MSYKQRLELDWIGKDLETRLEPRILIEDESKSFGNNNSGNMLIHGDNLLALKALQTEYKSKVKCIYIDPPYNTGNAFEFYDDGLEHSIWLSMMRDRLVLLRELLTDDGFIFIQIDNNEMAYLKVLMDEIFGRENFVNDIIWKRRGGSANPTNRLNNVTDYILWYSKSQTNTIQPIYTLNDENTQEYIEQRFTGEHNGEKYMLAPIERNKKLGTRETLRYEYGGYIPEYGWMMSRTNLERMDSEGKLHWNSKGRPNRRVFLSEYKGQPIGNLWTDVKVVNPMSKERTDFDGGQKPESLIERLILLTTDEGDIVLDSFLGSGTTAATAHKMNRRWIGIELGDHCYTHCIPRLTKIVMGKDDGGISSKYSWKGGGGFNFYTLAPSLLQKDDRGNWIINNEYNSLQLAEAVCKHENFKFSPHESIYWKQGYSGEKDFIFVTTQFLTSEHLDRIQEQMQKDETLLICAKAFRVKKEKYTNITLKKIPQMLLGRCEFGKEDYSLNIKEEVQEGLGMDLDA